MTPQKLATILTTVSIAAVAQLFFAPSAKAYQPWEMPFSNETFNAPMQRHQGGQEYGDNYCNNRWNELSNGGWNGSIASVDGRQIQVNSKNHVWYHWDNRQCVANVNSVNQAWDYYNPWQPGAAEVPRTEPGIGREIFDFGVGVLQEIPEFAPGAFIIQGLGNACDVYQCFTPIRTQD
jgi:hypothetical protein